jgi:uncharacterized protein (DUF58 family)
VSAGAPGGAYVSIADLVALRHQGWGFSFLPRQPIHSQLAGIHASRLRGRGLDFDELRAYQPGDDVRDIDWKVTARMRRPHTRVYREERDRSTLLLVDQRVNMFFGSRVQMKSVTAAHAAALGVWRVLAQGDRPGAIVFNDAEEVEIRPRRSESSAMAILHATCKLNQALRANDGRRSDKSRLNRMLERAALLARHDHLVVVVSDMDGADDETNTRLNLLTRHNDVVVVLVYDPLERELPDASLLVVSDGELQLEVDARNATLRSEFTQAFQETVDSGRKELHKRKVPMLPISTAEPVSAQVRALLGNPAQRRQG